MANKCYQCGTIYDGWSCPVCSAKEELEQQQQDMQRSMEKSAKEQQEAIEVSLMEQERMLEEQREAIESANEAARLEMEYALGEAAARHEKTTSEAWKLQAEAKTDRAYELYKADLCEEAIKLCWDAISQDPGNIRAYRFAGWSFEKLGQDVKIRYYVKKQISLLKTTYYNNHAGHALRVLQDILEIHNNEDLAQSFLDASKEFSYFPADLIDELIKHSLYDIAQKLYLNTIKHSETLLGHAYGIELNNKVLGKEDTDRLNKFLKSLPFTQRITIVHSHTHNIFEAFKGVRSSGKFSDNTINLLKKEILKIKKEWKPEIKRTVAELAAEEAAKKSSPTVIGWIVGIVGYYFWWSDSSFGVDSFVNNFLGPQLKGVIDDRFGTLLGVALIFVPPVVACLITSYSIRKVLEKKKKFKLIISMMRKEKEALNTIR